MIAHQFAWAPQLRVVLSTLIAIIAVFVFLHWQSRRRSLTTGATKATQEPRVRWRDHVVEVKARVVPRYAWITTSIDAYLDEVALIKTGGVIRIRGTNEAVFDEQGEHHVMKLAWSSPARGMDFPFQLSVDDQIIIDSKIRPPNWGLSLMMVILFVWSLIGLFALAVYFGRLYLR